jgi:hypothetical protein
MNLSHMKKLFSEIHSSRRARVRPGFNFNASAEQVVINNDGTNIRLSSTGAITGSSEVDDLRLGSSIGHVSPPSSQTMLMQINC